LDEEGQALLWSSGVIQYQIKRDRHDKRPRKSPVSFPKFANSFDSMRKPSAF